jgi:hypothetical protein
MNRVRQDAVDPFRANQRDAGASENCRVMGTRHRRSTFPFVSPLGDVEENSMIQKVVGGVTEGVSSLTEQVTPIAEKVLETGQATLQETQELASAVLEGGDVAKEISDIAEKVSEGGQATLEETKKLAAYVLGKE